jgi:hypothetical protein
MRQIEKQTLKVKKSKPYSFLKNKTARIFEQALKSGLTLPTCKRPTDIDRASEGEFCPYHCVLGHTIEDCWVFKDFIEKGYKDGTIQLPKSFQQDPTLHNPSNKGKGVAYTISHTPVPGKPKAARRKSIREIYRPNRLIFGGAECVGSRFNVLRARTHFWWYRWRRVPFSCFARPDSF